MNKIIKQFGERFILTDIKKELLFEKYLKIMNHKNFKIYFSDYIKSLDNEYDHEWINYIYYHEINNNIFIYYKKYFVLKINENIEINNDLVLKIIQNVKKIIIEKNILISILYLTDILNYNNENLKKNLLKNKYQIYIKIYKKEIKFYIKYNLFYNCKITELSENLNAILKKYKIIYNEKKKILLLTDNYFYFKSNEYFKNFIKNFYKKGYWLDTIFNINLNYFQNELEIKNKFYLLNKYSIIIYLDSCITLLEQFINFIKNKIIFIITTNFTPDTNTHINQLNNKIKKMNNRIILLGNNTDLIKNNINFFYYGIKNYDFLNFKNEKKITKINYNNLLPNLKDNDDVLSKNDFYKIFNLDITKKTITFFLTWPSINFKNTRNFMSCEYNNYTYENNYLIFILEKIKKLNKFNIIIKIHPNKNINIIQNKMYINNYNKLNKDKDLINDRSWNIHINNTKKFGIKNIFDNYKVIDNCFSCEVLKYTDYGILFYSSSIGFYNYIYKFPILYISHKINTINDYFYLWDIKKEYLKNEVTDLLNKYNINHEQLINIKDILYGETTYIEDLKKNFDEIFNDFINKKYNFKYYKNHKLFNNTYESTQNDFSNKIVSIINNHIINNHIINKNFNFIIDAKFSTIYCNNYLEIKINNNDILIKILKETIFNNNLLSYGLSLFIYNDNPLCNLNLKFKIKLKKFEENIYFRLYTGIKWIKYEDLKLNNNKYVFFDINEDFNLESKSKWRLSTNSTLVNQEIEIKDLNILLNK